MRRDGRQIDAELCFHGESYGWECQFLHDGEMAYGRRWALRAQALTEADEKRHELERTGWIVIDG